MEIEMGKGNVFVGEIFRKEDECFGLLFCKVDQQHAIGEKDPDWKDGEPYKPKDTDVVIWVPSLDSARVILDRVAILNLQLNGYQVIDT
ncbi:MAG: hypothetical protein LLG40_09975 [Deltaproteobacteria bacterium]|nr:hypothetical protein [Deltaproteobacteria bacterium]